MKTSKNPKQQKNKPNKKPTGMLFKERKCFDIISFIFLAVLFQFYAVSKDFHFLSGKHFQNLFFF